MCAVQCSAVLCYAVLCCAIHPGYRAAAQPDALLSSDVGRRSRILETCKAPCMCSRLALMDGSKWSIDASSRRALPDTSHPNPRAFNRTGTTPGQAQEMTWSLFSLEHKLRYFGGLFQETMMMLFDLWAALARSKATCCHGMHGSGRTNSAIRERGAGRGGGGVLVYLVGRHCVLQEGLAILEGKDVLTRGLRPKGIRQDATDCK